MEKQQVFYIHGADAFSKYDDFLEYLKKIDIRDLPGAKPSKRWTHTLRDDLGDEYEVFMPSMPNKLNAHYLEWKIWFERHFEHLHDDIILVGWSCGAYFLVKYLLENDFPFRIKALFLLAAPYENVESDPDGEDGGDFAFDTNELPELQNKVDRIAFMHSEDDFVVPYEHARKYQTALPAAELVTFVDKNHFLIEEFPELLERIRALA